MVERQPRSGVRITIKTPRQLDFLPDKPLPTEIHLQSGQHTAFSALHINRMNQSTIAPPQKSELWINAADNYVSMTGLNHYVDANLLKKIFWAHTDVSPHGHLHLLNPVNANVWELFFAENPNEQSTETFGRSVELIEVEFLGHPDEMLADIMAQQQTEYQADLVAHFPQPDSTVGANVWKRSIIKTSPVISSTVHHEGYDRKQNQRYPYQYDAQVMYFIELKSRDNTREDKHEVTLRKIPSSVRIGLSIIPNSDHKLRIYHSEWINLEKPKRKKKAKADEPQVSELKTDEKRVVVGRTLAAVVRLANQAVNDGQLHIDALERWSSQTEPTPEELLVDLEPEVLALLSLLTNRKKVTKKKQA